MNQKQQTRTVVTLVLLVVLILFTSIRTSPIRCSNYGGPTVTSSILKQRQFVATDPCVLIPLLAFIGLIVLAETASPTLDSEVVPCLFLGDCKFNRPPPTA